MSLDKLRLSNLAAQIELQKINLQIIAESLKNTDETFPKMLIMI